MGSGDHCKAAVLPLASLKSGTLVFAPTNIHSGFENNTTNHGLPASVGLSNTRLGLLHAPVPTTCSFCGHL